MPKIIGASLAEHREATRTLLFESLSSLMERRSFDSITLAEIAAEAGIGRTAIYNHFPDKETLLLAYIEHETAQYLAHLDTDLHAGLDPLERLRRYIRRQFELKRFFHVMPGPALIRMVSPETRAQLRDHVGVVERRLQAILAAAIEQGLIPDQDVRTVSALVHACVTSRAIPDAEPERSRLIHTTETFVLRALGAQH